MGHMWVVSWRPSLEEDTAVLLQLTDAPPEISSGSLDALAVTERRGSCFHLKASDKQPELVSGKK